jgi:hypothetical protein
MKMVAAINCMNELHISHSKLKVKIGKLGV